MTDIAVTVSRDPQGNVMVMLKDLQDNCLAGATFPPELWYSLKGALAVIEDKMLKLGWVEPHEYDLLPIGDEGAATWN